MLKKIIKVKKRKSARTLTDSQFCDALGISGALNKEVCIVIRKLVANEIGCQKEELDPAIETKKIFRNSWRAFIGEEIFADLERELSKRFDLSIKINDDQVMPFMKISFFRFIQKAGATTLGEWILSLTEYLVKQIEELGHSREKGIAVEKRKQ